MNVKRRTVSATWTRLVVDALKDYGLDVVELCSKAGIKSSDLKNPYFRFPADCLTYLWMEAAKVSDDPAIGLVMSNRLSLMQLDTMVYSFISCVTLGDAFTLIKRFQHILSQSIDITISKEAEGYFIDFVHHGDEFNAAPQTTDASFAACLEIVKWVSVEQVTPLRVELEHPAYGKQSIYERVFCSPTVFDAERNRVLISVEDFERPMPTAQDHMADSHIAALTDTLHKIQSSELVSQVEDLIFKGLPTGNATIEHMLSKIHMTKRTFQRRLKEDGWTFKELLEKTRKELAKVYLCKGEMDVETISCQLGFAEPTAFMRAFKRWYGCSPVRYRKAYKMN